MLAVFPPWQALLDGVGWVLSKIYEVIPNYGVSIIILTILIRLVVLPLGIKQIKSTQSMQAVGPRIKELQKKYKGNKQKLQEETMKAYREAGVNPLGGCLPVVAQLPVLLAMYSVLRIPPQNAAYDPVDNPDVPRYLNNHLPEGSQLFDDVLNDSNMGFLFMNLQCSLVQAGTKAKILNSDRKPSGDTRDCGDSRFPEAIPYGVLLAIMVGSTLLSQRQLAKASPPGAASQQQQTLLKIMPVMFGFFGLQFPAGLVLYWTMSNLFQMGQQTLLLRAGHIGPQAVERRAAENRAKAVEAPAKKGFMARFVERADQRQEERESSAGRRGSGPQRGDQRKPPPSNRRSSGGSRGSGAKPKPKRPRPSKGSGS